MHAPITHLGSRLAEKLLDLLVPPRCAGCGRRDTWLCATCSAGLPRLPAEHCERCAAPDVPTRLCSACYRHPPPFDRLAAPHVHDGLARDLVLGLKFRGRRHLAPVLARFMAPLVEATADVIVPVPLHPARRRARGFNQAELLALELGRLVARPVRTDLLSRVRDTLPQTGLDDDDRRANVRGAFVASKAAGVSTVVLVDDVCTTGATIAACAHALRRAGVTSVSAAVATRAGSLMGQ